MIPEVEEIIELVSGSQYFLALGHLPTLEVNAIVTRTKKKGLKVMVSSVSIDMPGYPLEA